MAGRWNSATSADPGRILCPIPTSVKFRPRPVTIVSDTIDNKENEERTKERECRIIIQISKCFRRHFPSPTMFSRKNLLHSKREGKFGRKERQRLSAAFIEWGKSNKEPHFYLFSTQNKRETLCFLFHFVYFYISFVCVCVCVALVAGTGHMIPDEPTVAMRVWDRLPSSALVV